MVSFPLEVNMIVTADNKKLIEFLAENNIKVSGGKISLKDAERAGSLITQFLKNEYKNKLKESKKRSGTVHYGVDEQLCQTRVTNPQLSTDKNEVNCGQCRSLFWTIKD